MGSENVADEALAKWQVAGGGWCRRSYRTSIFSSAGLSGTARAWCAKVSVMFMGLRPPWP